VLNLELRIRVADSPDSDSDSAESESESPASPPEEAALIVNSRGKLAAMVRFLAYAPLPLWECKPIPCLAHSPPPPPPLVIAFFSLARRVLRRALG
jgi:hypothetical protein